MDSSTAQSGFGLKAWERAQQQASDDTANGDAGVPGPPQLVAEAFRAAELWTLEVAAVPRDDWAQFLGRGQGLVWKRVELPTTEMGRCGTAEWMLPARER